MPGFWNDRSRATSTSTTRATDRRAAPTSRRCRFRPCWSATATSGLARCERQPDSDLRPCDDSTRRAGGFIKQQFMGCDGNTPNVICPIAYQPNRPACLDALPTPTNGGPLNNYLAPRDPGHDSRQHRLLHGAVTTCRLAATITCSPASGTSARRRSSSRRCHRRISNETFLRSAELVGQPINWDQDLQPAPC